MLKGKACDVGYATAFFGPVSLFNRSSVLSVTVSVWLDESATCRLICRYCHLMLKYLALASCVSGFLFLVPKVLAEFAEFRRSRSQHHGPVLDKLRQDSAA